MSGFKRTNRLFMEHWVVPSANSAFPDGNLVDTGNALNIANGQLGVLSWDLYGSTSLGTFLEAGDTPDDAKAIKVIQGTPNSSNIQNVDIWEVDHKDKVESGIINAANIRTVSSSLYNAGNYSVSMFGNFSQLPVDKEYSAVIRLLSYKRDRDFGSNDDVITAVVPASTATPENPTAYVLANLAYKINERSVFTPMGAGSSLRGTKPIIAFGISRDGGDGQIIADIKAGDSFIYFSSNGANVSYTATPAFVTSMAKLIGQGAILATSTIEIIDLSLASEAENVISDIIIVGFDEKAAAYVDEVMFTRVEIEASLGKQFEEPTVTYGQYHVDSIEESNDGRKLLYAFRNRAGLNVHTMQNMPHGEYFSRGKEYILEDKKYNLNIIEYTEVEDTLTVESVTQAKLYIPTEVALGDLATLTVSDVATRLGDSDPAYPVNSVYTNAVSSLNSILAPWIAANNQVQYRGLSNTTTMFI